MYSELNVAGVGTVLNLQHVLPVNMLKSKSNKVNIGPQAVLYNCITITSMLPESKWELMTSLLGSPDSSMLSVLAVLVGAARPSCHLVHVSAENLKPCCQVFNACMAMARLAPCAGRSWL